MSSYSELFQQFCNWTVVFSYETNNCLNTRRVVKAQILIVPVYFFPKVSVVYFVPLTQPMSFSSVSGSVLKQQISMVMSCAGRAFLQQREKYKGMWSLFFPPCISYRLYPLRMAPPTFKGSISLISASCQEIPSQIPRYVPHCSFG